MLLVLLRRYLFPQWRKICCILTLQVAAVTTSLLVPLLNANVIDDGVLAGDDGYVLRLGGLMVLLSLVGALATIAALRIGSRLAMGVGRDIREAVFDHVQSLSEREIGGFGVATLITRTTNDAQQIQALILTAVGTTITAPLVCAGGTALAVWQDPSLAGVLPVAILVLGVVSWWVVRRLGPLFRGQQQRIDAINRILREQIAGIRVIRAFVQDKREQQRFGEANDELRSYALSIGRLLPFMNQALALVVNVSVVAVFWVGAVQIQHGSLPIGALISFVGYLTLILGAVFSIVNIFVMAPRALVCADRLVEVLEAESSVLEPAEPTAQLPHPGRVDVQSVSFAYPSSKVDALCEVSFTVQPGQLTAIVGSTGSGKSTLMSLMARLFDASSGEVRIAGADVRDISSEQLHRHVGIVPQRPYLFAGTVAENLRYGSPGATDTELWHALQVCQAFDFVSAMPDGIDSPIGQGGTTVSGGQRQRLAIARALLARPEIYLFDDSFSALDYDTDARLRSALFPEVAGATLIVVAQRLNTIRNADQILVLDAGRVVGVGTHDSLLEGNPTYREIAQSQPLEQQVVR